MSEQPLIRDTNTDVATTSQQEEVPKILTTPISIHCFSEILSLFWGMHDIVDSICDFLDIKTLARFAITSKGSLEIIRNIFSRDKDFIGLMNQKNNYAIIKDIIKNRCLPFIPIPEIAKGHEGLYKQFISWKLIYKKGQPDQVILPFSSFLNSSNPLEGTFDLSQCGNTGKSLIISIGYHKLSEIENAGRIGIWIAPIFSIKKEFDAAASYFGVCSSWYASISSIGIFWTADVCTSMNYNHLILDPSRLIPQYRSLYDIHPCFTSRGPCGDDRHRSCSKQLCIFESSYFTFELP